MRTEPISRELMAGPFEPPTDIEMVMHAAWLLAGVAIALAASGCTLADEAKMHTLQPQNENVAHAAPSATAASSNVEDLTY